MDSGAEMRLPDPVANLVDGRGLTSKIGQTISLISIDDQGWPRLALLSIGEVYSSSGTGVMLALHANSGTTAALTSSGRALLNTVIDAVNYRIRIQVERLHSGPGPLAFFKGFVVGVDEDRVPYAQLTSGITYSLNDEEAVVVRWQQQLDEMKGLAS
jgi:hypothetical protein